VRAREVRTRPPLGVELDELALVDLLAQESLVLGARTVDPVDARGLRERGDLVHPRGERFQARAGQAGRSRPPRGRRRVGPVAVEWRSGG
jgi:hypothetical protein